MLFAYFARVLFGVGGPCNFCTKHYPYVHNPDHTAKHSPGTRRWPRSCRLVIIFNSIREGRIYRENNIYTSRIVKLYFHSFYQLQIVILNPRILFTDSFITYAFSEINYCWAGFLMVASTLIITKYLH